MRVIHDARCPQCSSLKVEDTGYTHNDERTLECMKCGSHFEESDA